jgi:hypothetical protein
MAQSPGKALRQWTPAKKARAEKLKMPPCGGLSDTISLSHCNVNKTEDLAHASSAEWAFQVYQQLMLQK